MKTFSSLPVTTAPFTRTAQCEEPRILIVDDELDLWWGASIPRLVGAGYKVDTAEDGDAGWRVVRTNPYLLLITDNKMPKLSGLELIQRLRSSCMALPVVLASSSPPLEEIQRNADLNIEAVLQKPVRTTQLLQHLDDLLRRGNGLRIPPSPSECRKIWPPLIGCSRSLR